VRTARSRELNRLSEAPRHPGVIRLKSDDEIYRVRIGDLRLTALELYGLYGAVFEGKGGEL